MATKPQPKNTYKSIRRAPAKKSTAAEGPKRRTPNKKADLVDKTYQYSIGSSRGWSKVSPAIAKAKAIKKAAAEGPKRRTPAAKVKYINMAPKKK